MSGERGFRLAWFTGRTPAWIAAAASLTIVMLTVFGYRAIREWQRSSVQLVEQRAEQGADLLVSALSRDMAAVQKSVLSLPTWNSFMLDSPYDDVRTITTSAMARYPYPEAFFAGRGNLSPAHIVFFSRSNRLPPWASEPMSTNQFPVSVDSQPAIAEVIMRRIGVDMAQGKSYSIFDAQLGGTDYQVVARLLYSDRYREHLEGVFGFLVNREWVRAHYFPELADEVARIGELGPALTLEIITDAGQRVTTAPTAAALSPVSRRPFPVMFFDPLIVVADPPADLLRQEWVAQVSVGADPMVSAAFRGANRTLLLAAVAAGSLAVAFVLSARALEATAKLADIRADFVASVTHELKSPIATIQAVGASLLAGRVTTVESQREYTQIAMQEAKKLNRLVDNLLALSRITDVAAVYAFEPLAIDALVAEALTDFRQQLAASEFTTTVDVPAGLPPIRADHMAMELVLANLIDNAIRYSPTEHHLAIVATETGNGQVAVTFSDCGRGIPHDEIPLVTRRFYRGRLLGPGGSGLGLAIVQRIVKDHAGQLTIESTEGVGTSVRIVLPVFADD
jgi:signal transduction histidine kinase